MAAGVTTKAALVPGYEAVLPGRPGSPRTAKARLASALVLSAGGLALAALALVWQWRGSPFAGGTGAGRGGPLASELDSVESKIAVESEVFTCGRYGCLDVRSLNACQCSPFCLKEGNCCKDFQAVCAATQSNLRLGFWDGCEGSGHPSPPPPGGWAYVAHGPPLEVKVLSYNPEWWHVIEQLGGNGNSIAKVIVGASKPHPFDFMGFQEFYDPWYGLTRPGFEARFLLTEYMFIRGEVGGPLGTIIGFRNDTWTLLSRGQRFVGEDQKQGSTYFGKRIAFWARFSHRKTGKKVFFMNHHGPLPSDTGGICGGKATAQNLLRVVAKNAQAGDAVIFVGDFNAVAGSPTIKGLTEKLHRCFDGIDHIFTNLPASSVVDQTALESGGSDHPAISALLRLPGQEATEAPAVRGSAPAAIAE